MTIKLLTLKAKKKIKKENKSLSKVNLFSRICDTSNLRVPFY